jgi:hypothetical protein
VELADAVAAGAAELRSPMVHQGLEVDLHLREGLANDGFVAEALGNLAAYELARRRGEPLVWQVLRVELGRDHHFRLIVRHPERRLDLGFTHDLRGILHSLSAQSVEGLRTQLAEAEAHGLKLVRLRHIREQVDYWHDDFWNWIG